MVNKQAESRSLCPSLKIKSSTCIAQTSVQSSRERKAKARYGKKKSSNDTYEARPVRIAFRLLSVESTHFFILLSASFVTPATSPSIVTAMRLWGGEWA